MQINILALVKSETGCHDAYWGPIMGEPDKYAIVERYINDAALKAHQESTHMAKYGPILAELCDSPPTTILFNDA